MRFRYWLEQEDIRGSILGVLPDELKGNHDQETKILQMKTTQFGPDVIDRLKNLGIISSLRDDNPQKWQNIIDSIKHGITFEELINNITDSDSPNLIADPRLVTTANQLPNNPLG